MTLFQECMAKSVIEGVEMSLEFVVVLYIYRVLQFLLLINYMFASYAKSFHEGLDPLFLQVI